MDVEVKNRSRVEWDWFREVVNRVRRTVRFQGEANATVPEAVSQISIQEERVNDSLGELFRRSIP